MKSYLAANALLQLLGLMFVAPYQANPQLTCPSGWVVMKPAAVVGQAYEITCLV